jgi:hypothetical protein
VPDPDGRARPTNRARVADVYDKGKGAGRRAEIVSSTTEETPLFTNRASIFVRGEGGFGGESGPEPGNPPPDARAGSCRRLAPPSRSRRSFTGSQGTRTLFTPIRHSRLFGGFDRPILHGLCSYGVVCKAVVDGVRWRRGRHLCEFRARFSGVVYPGETIVTRVWQSPTGGSWRRRHAERGSVVISNASIAAHADA